MDRSVSRVLRTVLIVILVIAIMIGGGYGLAQLYMQWTSGTDPLPVPLGERPTTTVTTSGTATETTPTTAPPLPENPVNFAEWHAINTDIYAFLDVPGTPIQYPVACATDQADGFYLDHNIYREYEFAGTIYSEKKNGTDLMHRNTVMYGHNMLNGTMFSSLHDFEDKEFFDKYDKIYVYTPGHIYTYTIFAAYEYDNRHLLNSFDYSNDEVWADYLSYATDPKTFTVNTRDVPVTISDRIITLSTCVGWNKNARYLVQGVLTDDQLTQ